MTSKDAVTIKNFKKKYATFCKNGTFARVVLLTQFGANFISQLIASVSDLSKARVASENILNVIKETAVDMNNLSDEGLRPVSLLLYLKKGLVA